MIPLVSASSFLCLCRISSSAIPIILSAAPGTIWSYLAKSSGGGSGPEKLLCSAAMLMRSICFSSARCGLLVFLIRVPYVIANITPVSVDSFFVADPFSPFGILPYGVFVQQEEGEETLPEHEEQASFCCMMFHFSKGWLLFVLQIKRISFVLCVKWLMFCGIYMIF